MNIEISDKHVIDLIHKYYIMTNAEGLCNEYNNIINRANNSLLVVDNTLLVSIIPDARIITIDNGALIEGKLILPFKLYCDCNAEISSSN